MNTEHNTDTNTRKVLPIPSRSNPFSLLVSPLNPLIHNNSINPHLDNKTKEYVRHPLPPHLPHLLPMRNRPEPMSL